MPWVELARRGTAGALPGRQLAADVLSPHRGRLSNASIALWEPGRKEVFDPAFLQLPSRDSNRSSAFFPWQQRESSDAILVKSYWTIYIKEAERKKNPYLNSQGWVTYVNVTHPLVGLNILAQQFLTALSGEQLVRRVGLLPAGADLRCPQRRTSVLT